MACMKMQRDTGRTVARFACGLCLAFAATVPAITPALAQAIPASGKMLIATRDLNDPNFSETVILLVDHDEGGSMGIVINRPTRVAANTAVPQIEDLEAYTGRLFFGGPVEIESLVVLFRAEETPQGARRVLDDIHVSQDGDLLAELASKGLGDSELRLYAGYAGWFPGQLDMEIERGGWHVLPGRAALVFDDEPGSVWRKTVPPPEPIMTMLLDKQAE
jgi:putative transcriptional regulator